MGKTMSDTAIAKLLKKQRDISKRGLAAQYDNTAACIRFYNGEDQTYQDRIQFLDADGRRRRATVNFNKVQANVDAVGGFMAQNRRMAKFVARVDASKDREQYSKDMNALNGFHRERNNADQLESDQDMDMLINGYGAIETDLSYIMGNSTNDPNGEIIKVKLDPMRMGWDPGAKERNLTDARWVYYFDDYELNDALNLFQGSVKEDFESVDAEDAADMGYVYNPWGGLYDKIKLVDSVEWSSKAEDMVRVYNHQWFEYETFYKAYNPLYLATDLNDAMFIKMRLDMIHEQTEDEGPDGIEVEDAFEFDPKAEELIFDEKTKRVLIKEFGNLIKPIAFKRKCYYTAVTSGDHVFTKFKSVSQNGFSVKFKTGVYNDTNKFWMGMVNPLMEPQKYYNKAITELLFTIASNSKGGVMVEEDAIEDIAEFETKWAKTNAVIKVQSGAISGGKIQEKARPAVPTGLESIITLSENAISYAGVDPSFLGEMNDKDESGILQKRRIRQVVSKMARYFDSITKYQKEDARLMADLIPVWVQNNNGKWINITGPDGKDEFIQVSEDKLAPDYDVSIQEAPQTPEDKQVTAGILGTYGDRLLAVNPQAGMQFYAASLQMMPIDGDIRNKLVESLAPQAPQIDPAMVQAMQDRINELESEQNQAMVAKTLADAKYSEARAMQTMVNNEAIRAKIPLTQAQTVKTVEEAKRTHVEANMAASAPEENTTVNV